MQSVSIARQLLARYGVTQSHVEGNYLRSRCPLHGGDSDRGFLIDYNTGRYHCFSGCSEEQGKGNLVKLISLMENKPILEARGILKSLGATFKWTSSQQPEDSKPLSEDQIKAYWQNTERTAYRQWNEDQMDRFSIRMGCSGKYSGRIWIPLANAEGHIVSYKGRAYDNWTLSRKYLYMPNVAKSRLLYDPERANRKKTTVVCEGEFDTINLILNGYRSVSTMGAKFSGRQVELLKDFKSLVLFFDNDEDGKNKSFELAEKLDNIQSVVFPPPLSDAGDLHAEKLYYILGRMVDNEC